MVNEYLRGLAIQAAWVRKGVHTGLRGLRKPDCTPCARGSVFPRGPGAHGTAHASGIIDCAFAHPTARPE